MSSAKTKKPTKTKKNKGPAKLRLDVAVSGIKNSAKLAGQDETKDPVVSLLENGISSPLIICSEQALRTKRLVSWLKEKVFEESNATVTSYFGTELTKKDKIDNIISSLTSLSLFSSTQLIAIYEADKVKAAMAKPLVEAIKKSVGSTFVVLCATSYKQTAPLLTGLADTAKMLELSEFNNAELIRWIKKEALSAGAHAGVEPDAAALLAKCYGNDVGLLSNEIAKLALLVEDDKPIDKKLVENMALKTPEHTSFELFTQIGRKNVPISSRLLKDLLNQGLHPLQLTSFLSRCFRTLLAQKGDSPASGELNNPWFVRKLSSSINAFSIEELIDGVNVLKETDMKLKGSGLPDELVISLGVQKLAERRI